MWLQLLLAALCGWWRVAGGRVGHLQLRRLARVGRRLLLGLGAAHTTAERSLLAWRRRLVCCCLSRAAGRGNWTAVLLGVAVERAVGGGLLSAHPVRSLLGLWLWLRLPLQALTAQIIVVLQNTCLASL